MTTTDPTTTDDTTATGRTTAPDGGYDPITIEIIQNSLQATADEMFAAMRKTAMSSIIYEVLDMGTGVTDAHGEIASSGAGIPAFVGVLDKAAKVIIEKFDHQGGVEPGDVFLTNDPYRGGVTHLNDIVVLMPVFAGGTLIAWTANIAHNSDVGGMAPGSLTGEATEIYQEGLRIPAIKAISRGEVIPAVMDIILANSRMPETIEGDVWAAIAAVRIGARRLAEVAAKYGADVFVEAMRRHMDHGEAVARKALAELPAGTYEISEEQDNGLVLKASITISAESFVVDLRDNPPQNDDPNNCSRDAVMVAAQMIFKSLTAPDSPASSGSFRPIELLTERGTVFDAEEPSPMGFYYELELRAYDLLWRCLAPVVPDVFGAGHFASVCGTFIGGVHPDTGRQYTIIEPQLGGWGGTHARDGNSAMFSGFHGETYNCPAEINEIRNGLFVERMELNTEPGGEGRTTGGRGIVMEYRVRSNDGYLTMDYTRSKFPAWGTEGGLDGSPNYCEVVRAADGDTQRYSSVSGLDTSEGDLIRIVTGNGGGHGDPRGRNPELVREDVKNGLLSAERAAEVFGVTVTDDADGDPAVGGENPAD
ncbi:MAG: hydantoinase B/oxoprolinase family protein [Actinomycetota bacterium]